jgi:putative zinc finger/helix-turn-helix YgiT family protein
MTCFECGQGSLVSGDLELVGERNGESFAIPMEGLKCDHCGFQTIDSEQSSEFTRLVSDAYREKHGLLKGAEIRACRAQLGMTQQQFSDYLGTGVASVKRWEAGQIQDKAMDELIRLKTDPVAARRNLRSLERQVPEPVIIFDSEDMALTLAAGETHYSERPTMTIEKMVILHDHEGCGFDALWAA